MNLRVPTVESFFNEFPIELGCDPSELSRILNEHDFLGGVPTEIRGKPYYLFAFTEVHPEEAIVRLMEVLSEIP
jgi:hypothetical protein